MPYLPLTLFLLIVAILLGVAVIFAMAVGLLRPPRMTDGRALHLLNRITPADIGLRYEAVYFDQIDPARAHSTGGRGRLRLSAWWMPARMWSDTTIILLHGYGDAKIGAIAWAPMLVEMGTNVLAVDLRAHGESGGQHSTAGFYERDDIDALINQIRIDRPDATRRIFLFGISLGGAVALAVADRRDDIAGVTIDSPFTTYPEAVAAHARRRAMPLEFAFGLVAKVAEKISGARFKEVRPTELIKTVKCPLLVIVSGGDSFVTIEQQMRLLQSYQSRPANRTSEYLLIESAEHIQGLAVDPASYEAAVARLLVGN